MSEIKDPDELMAAGPSRLDRPGHARLTWHHTIAPGRNYLDATKSQYWYACAHQLGPGHRIEIWSSDHRIAFEAFVIECNPDSAPNPRVDLFFKPLMPADLPLPLAPILQPSRWVAKQSALGGSWEVTDVERGTVVQSNMHKSAAQQLVGNLEMAASEAAERSKGKNSRPPVSTGLGRDRAPA